MGVRWGDVEVGRSRGGRQWVQGGGERFVGKEEEERGRQRW